MATCTTASIDIAIDPQSVTVASAVGFSIGDTVSIDEAIGAGQPLVTTITNIAGVTITIADPASATITNEQFCLVSNSGTGGWFGPDGPCICACACSCDQARDDYAHTNVAITGGAAGVTYDLSSDLVRVCFGESITPATWAFPGVANVTTAIDTTECFTDATRQVAVQQTADQASWGGTTEPLASGCTAVEALVGRYVSFGIPGAQNYVTLSGVVTYSCVDAIYDYRLLVFASYVLLNPDFATSDAPTWAWITDTVHLIHGTKTIGGVVHVFRMELLHYGSADERVYQLSLAAEVSDPTLTVSLGTPPYDPHGLLVGTATIT